MENIKNILEKTIDWAKKEGAEQADVIYTAGDTLSAKAENSKISEYQVYSSQTIGVRVIKDKKVGLSYCESLEDGALKELVSQAVNNSKYSKIEPCEEISLERKEEIDGTQEFSYSDLRVDPKELFEKTLMIERELKAKDKRVKNPPYNGVGEGVSREYHLNHLGTYSKSKEKSYYAYTSALIEDGDDHGMFTPFIMGREFSDLDFKYLIDHSYETAAALLKAKPMKTGHYDVVFHIDKLATFIGNFANMFSGYAATKNLNPWKEKIGEKVASELFSMKDEPHRRDGYSYTVVDAEGYMMKDTSLMENGVLKNFYQNSSTSRQLGMENTFNAARSPRSGLAIGSTHKVITPGETKQEEISKHRHFRVIELQGIHSGSNQMSGDFSFGASGFLYEDGEIVQAVKGVTISGNFFDAIKNIRMMGDDAKMNASGNFYAPSIVFSDFSIAGS